MQPVLCGTKSGVNSHHIGVRLQWSVQVCLNQLSGPLGHPGPLLYLIVQILILLTLTRHINFGGSLRYGWRGVKQQQQQTIYNFGGIFVQSNITYSLHVIVWWFKKKWSHRIKHEILPLSFILFMDLFCSASYIYKYINNQKLIHILHIALNFTNMYTIYCMI